MGTIATRMGFDPADVDTLTELVRHHLLLPSIATSRDLDDPTTIEAVAATVGTVERLDLLHALTEADSLATGEAAWSPWKARLVQTLVDRVRAALGGEQRPVRPPAPDYRPRSGRPRRRATCWWRGAIDPSSSPRPTSPASSAASSASSDCPGRTSERHGRARPTTGSRSPSSTSSPPSASRPTGRRSRPTSARRSRGRIAIDARLAERAARYARLHRPSAAAPPETRVIVDNDASPDATFVEVRTADGIGVLYGIARTFADLQLDIRHARRSTPMGHEVVDSFYLVTEDGEKLVEPELLGELETADPLHARPARLTGIGPLGHCQSTVRYMSKIGNDRHTEAKRAVPNFPAMTSTLRLRLKDKDRQRFFVAYLGAKMIGITAVMAAVWGFMWFFSSSAGAIGLHSQAVKAADVVNPLNTVWVLVTAFLVFFMQAGFMMLEGGFARTREVSNIMIECIADTAMCGVLFWAFGFAFMFGGDVGTKWIGDSYFFLQGVPHTYGTTGVAFLAFFLFQFAFADTASTIVSGAMVGRTGLQG